MTSRLRSAGLTASVRLAPHNLEQEVADVGFDCGWANVQSPGDWCLVPTFSHRSGNYTFALCQVGAGLRRPAGGTDDDPGDIRSLVAPKFGRPDRVGGREIGRGHPDRLSSTARATCGRSEGRRTAR